MTTLTAPMRMRGRDQVAMFLMKLPDDLTGASLRIEFEDGALATTSFVDEIIRVVLADREADRLLFANLSSLMVGVAIDSARHYGVENRLVCS